MTKKHWKTMEWNCFAWDINADKLYWFNVLSDDLLKDIEAANKAKRLTNRAEFSAVVKRWAMWHYWSKREWEVIITDWPKRNNEYKMDVYEQLQNNWEIFTDYLIKGLELDL